MPACTYSSCSGSKSFALFVSRTVLDSPREEFSVAGSFTEPVFGLFGVVATFTEQSFEDSADVFVE